MKSFTRLVCPPGGRRRSGWPATAEAPNPGGSEGEGPRHEPLPAPVSASPSEPGIGVSDPAATVQTAVGHVAAEAPEDRRAVDACRSVVERAMHAHRSQKAGDNMGCSVLWLER